MWAYLWSILALGALCAAWILFQLWLERVDPGEAGFEERCRSCGGRTDRCGEKGEPAF